MAAKIRIFISELFDWNAERRHRRHEAALIMKQIRQIRQRNRRILAEIDADLSESPMSKTGKKLSASMKKAYDRLPAEDQKILSGVGA